MSESPLEMVGPPWGWRHGNGWVLTALRDGTSNHVILDSVQAGWSVGNRSATHMRLWGGRGVGMIGFRSDHPVAKCIEQAPEFYEFIRRVLPLLPPELAKEGRGLLRWVEPL